jgi:SanA protein
MKRNHFWRRFFIIVLILAITTTFAVNAWVVRSAEGRIYSDVTLIPHRKIGLLLGTSKEGKSKLPNWYYRYRIMAAIELFKAGKVDYILVSGDNGKESYNEPETMQADLIAGGVPAGRIILDYAGFRTLDSILRCKEVFGEDSITIISQQFHNERALFIAGHKEVDAIAYNAKDVNKRSGMPTQVREKLARVKMILDLLVNKGPKFYGPKIRIG